jgi:hypothetical protein
MSAPVEEGTAPAPSSKKQLRRDQRFTRCKIERALVRVEVAKAELEHGAGNSDVVLGKLDAATEALREAWASVQYIGRTS